MTRSNRRCSVAAACVLACAAVLLLSTAGVRASDGESLRAAFDRHVTKLRTNAGAPLGSVAAVSRSSASVPSGPPAFAVAAAERGGGLGRCAPGNCVSTEVELVDAVSEIPAAGGTGVIVICRDAPIELNRSIVILGSMDVTIECCDVQPRRSSSSLPACSIVTGPECGSTICDITFFNVESVTLSGILFDGSTKSPEFSAVGIVSYIFGAIIESFERRLRIADCVFRNVEGGEFTISSPYIARALNVIGLVREDPSDSIEIEIVRSGFFDNESGGFLLLVVSSAGSNGNVNVNVRDCQFERNGQALEFRVSANDNGGIAIIGDVESVVVESSRFIDNQSAFRGAALIVSRVLGDDPVPPIATESSSITLRDNLFRGNRCGRSTRLGAEAGAVYIKLDLVRSETLVAVENSDFFNNTAVGLVGEGSGGGLTVEDVLGEVRIDRCRFKGNRSGDAAAIRLFRIVSATITRAKVEDNVGRATRGDTSTVRFFNFVDEFGLEGALLVSRSKFKNNIGTHTSL